MWCGTLLLTRRHAVARSSTHQVRNDLPKPFKGTVTVSALHYGTGVVTEMGSSQVSLPAGGGALGFFCAGASSASPIAAGSYTAVSGPVQLRPASCWGLPRATWPRPIARCVGAAVSCAHGAGCCGWSRLRARPRPATLHVAAAAIAGIATNVAAAAAAASAVQTCPTFAEVFAKAGCKHNASDCMLNVTVTSTDGHALSQNMLPLGLPSDLNLQPASITHAVKAAPAGSSSVDVTLTSDHAAIFVWLTTAEHGRFTDNAFVLLPGAPITVTFLSFLDEGTSSDAVAATLRVEHLAMYCSGAAGMPCRPATSN